MDIRPIGIIDSGSGGLSLWDSVTNRLPQESIIYIGDHANAPYSDKSKIYIRRRIKALISELISRDCKLCIIACNTATVAGIDWYRKQFPNLPIVGVVPVIKTAAILTKTNAICILSTKFTAKSVYLKNLIKEFAFGKNVYSLGSSKLVSYIESIHDETEHVKRELASICKKVKSKKVDVVVLGCTHYPFIRNIIQSFFGASVRIIDSSEAVSRQTVRILEHNKIAARGDATYHFFTTGDASYVSAVVSKLMRCPIVVEHLAIS